MHTPPTDADRAQLAALGAALRLRAAVQSEPADPAAVSHIRSPYAVTLHPDPALALDAREMRRLADAAQAAAERVVALILEERRRDAALAERSQP